MADNRDLLNTFQDALNSRTYLSLAVVANYLFAQQHGYDFKFYHYSSINLTSPAVVEGVSRRRTAAGFKEHDPRNFPSCLHPGLRQVRAASWCKLLPSWLAAQENVELAMFLDSDAVVLDPNVSLHRYVHTEARARGHNVSWGATPLSSATVGFLSNRPWMSDYPVAGVFWFAPGAAATRFFAHWWDVDDPGHNWMHGFEQESLWLWMPLRPPGEVAVVDKASLEEAEGQWVRHFGGHRPELRTPGISAHLAVRWRLSPEAFAAAVAKIRADHYVELDVLAAAQRMEAARVAAAAPLPSFTFPGDGTPGRDTCSLINCYAPPSKKQTDAAFVAAAATAQA